MTILEWEKIAFRVASIAFIMFTLGFMFGVRWYTDLLGRTIAFVVGPIAVILGISLFIQFGVDIPNIIMVAAVLYTIFAAAMCTALGVFVWVQFIAPFVHRRRKDRT